MSQMLCGLHGSSVSQATSLEKACVILCRLLMIPSFFLLVPLWMRPPLIWCEEVTLNIYSFNVRFLTGWQGPAEVWSCRIFHAWSVIFKLSASCSGNKPCLYQARLFSRNMRLMQAWLITFLSQGGLICNVVLSSWQLIQCMFHLVSSLACQP